MKIKYFAIAVLILLIALIVMIDKVFDEIEKDILGKDPEIVYPNKIDSAEPLKVKNDKQRWIGSSVIRDGDSLIGNKINYKFKIILVNPLPENLWFTVRSFETHHPHLVDISQNENFCIPIIPDSFMVEVLTKNGRYYNFEHRIIWRK